jgi:hypothetical protein
MEASVGRRASRILRRVEIVDRLSLQIGGVVEFYRLGGSQRDILARLPDHTSHALGPRNLDAAVAGDFDGDDRTEPLVPDRTATSPGAIRHETSGAEVAWTGSVGGRISMNLAAVTLPGDTLSLGVGHEGNMLRRWLSE